MIWSLQLLLFLIRLINNRGRHYIASLPDAPRAYAESCGDGIRMSYRRGIELRREKDSYWLTTHGFVFEPEIKRYVIRHARHDKAFKERLLSQELSSDDVEKMIYELSHHGIRLYLSGRKEDIYNKEE